MHNLPYPFSFLHLIFINRQTLSEANHGAMLEHERVHIRQWHWLDLILLELLVAVQWFNPFAWLFRRSVKELHEYLADEEVLKQTPKLDYQMLLFNQVCGTNMYLPVNGFKSSLTKKRILMMNNQRNKKWFAVFAVLVMAIFAIQTLSKVNLAQDPPKVTKETNIIVGDTIKRKYSPLPHSPLFNGTNSFGESNLAFGNFIINKVNLPPSFLKSTGKNGIPLHVFFNSNGKITKVKLGDFYYIKGIPEIKVTDRKDILEKISQVLYEAPPFKIIEIKTKKGELKICNEVGYAVVFENNKCQVIPHQYMYSNKN
jgi:cell division protein FtsB